MVGGNDLEGELRFSVDAETSEAVYEGAFVRKRSGALGPYEFETGDTFVVKRQIINTLDGSLEMEAGGALVIGKQPPQLLNLPASTSWVFGRSIWPTKVAWSWPI